MRPAVSKLRLGLAGALEGCRTAGPVELVRASREGETRRAGYLEAVTLCAERGRCNDVDIVAGAAREEGIEDRGMSPLPAQARVQIGRAAQEQEVISKNPADPQPILMQADALWRAGQYLEASQMAARAIAVAPTWRPAYEHLAWILREVHEIEGACETIERALRVPGAPGDVVSSLVLKGSILLSAGELDSCLKVLDEARRLAPEHPTVASSGLMARLYDGKTPLAELSAAHFAEGERLSAQWRHARFDAWSNQRDPERCIRVGFVSGDLSHHPVGLILASLLPHLDPARVSITLYNTGVQSDHVSQKLRRMVGAWRDLTHMHAPDAAQLVRADRIDLLVDLSGHTRHNRLDLLALRSAPVQLSWAGYVYTTGLPEIDAMVQDVFTASGGQDQYYSEKLVRLPVCVYTYAPLDEPPPVAAGPMVRNGYVTFGCFNQLSKLSDSTLRLWAGAMQAVPDSRLMLKSGPLHDHATRARILGRLDSHGIAPERCILIGPSVFHEYLEQYSMVDIALDPVPFNGGATTLQGLWQGVPVLTMPGQHHLSRVGGSIMHALGLDDWIATSPEHFAALAQQHASDAAALDRLRQGMRARLRGTAVGNPALFAEHMMAAWRKLWRAWCEA